jgi:uncharacterized protein
VSSPLYSRVLVDTGPLVAMLSRRDSNHEIAAMTLKQIAPPMLTIWPVLTEVQWLLRQEPAAFKALVGLTSEGILQLLPLDKDDLLSMERLFKKYQSLTPQLADIALFHLSIREQISTIFTFDRRDFTTFARASKGKLKLIPEQL